MFSLTCIVLGLNFLDALQLNDPTVNNISSYYSRMRTVLTIALLSARLLQSSTFYSPPTYPRAVTMAATTLTLVQVKELSGEEEVTSVKKLIASKKNLTRIKDLRCVYKDVYEFHNVF